MSDPGSYLVAATFAATLLGTSDLSAQFVSSATPVLDRSARLPTIPGQEPSRTGTMAAAGTVAAVGGFFVGGLLGSSIEDNYFPCACDDPGLEGFLVGAALGTAMTIPVAVHLANRRQGKLLPTLAVSLAIGFAAVGAVYGSSAEVAVPVYFGAPIAETIVSIVMERSGARPQ